MTEPRLDPPDPLAALAPPAAPPELRGRVLSAAHAALLEPPIPEDPWNRIWESRAARLAWAAAVLLLLGGNALVPRPLDVRPAPSANVLARFAPGPEAEIAAIGRLPRLDLDARPLRAEAGSPVPRHVPPAHAPAKETRS